MTIKEEKLYYKAELDALPSTEELAIAFMEDADLCYAAVNHYLKFRPDRWVELAKSYN